MESLGDELPREIKRVQGVRSQYESVSALPGVNCGPAIAMMTAAIDRGVQSLASGDVIEMIGAYSALKQIES